MPINYADYPANWQAMRQQAFVDANGCCVGSPYYPHCRATHGEPHPATGSTVVLALCHVDQDVTNNDSGNLRLWCQRCHLRHDLGYHLASVRYGRNYRVHQLQFPFVAQLPRLTVVTIPIYLQLYIPRYALRKGPPPGEQLPIFFYPETLTLAS